MGFRFRKSFKLFPGVKLNLGKRGVSLTAGVPGAHPNIGRRGVRTTVGAPGTGISYSHLERYPAADSAPSVAQRQLIRLWLSTDVFMLLDGVMSGPLSMYGVLSIIATGEAPRDTMIRELDGDWEAVPEEALAIIRLHHQSMQSQRKPGITVFAFLLLVALGALIYGISTVALSPAWPSPASSAAQQSAPIANTSSPATAQESSSPPIQSAPAMPMVPAGTPTVDERRAAQARAEAAVIARKYGGH